jgi:hypothetical protein
MAIIKNTYNPATTVIQPFFVQISKATQGDFIIIDDINAGYTHKTRHQVDADEVWLELKTDYSITILNQAPANLTHLDQYNRWSDGSIRFKGGEVFVAQRAPGAADDAQPTELDGYQLGAMDKLYVKIDRGANTIDVFK